LKTIRLKHSDEGLSALKLRLNAPAVTLKNFASRVFVFYTNNNIASIKYITAV